MIFVCNYEAIPNMYGCNVKRTEDRTQNCWILCLELPTVIYEFNLNFLSPKMFEMQIPQIKPPVNIPQNWQTSLFNIVRWANIGRKTFYYQEMSQTFFKYNPAWHSVKVKFKFVDSES